MGIKAGIVVGFAVGYFFGAKAGRERYEQIRELLGELGDSELLEQVQAALELGIDRVIGDRGDTALPSGVVQDSSR